MKTGAWELDGVRPLELANFREQAVGVRLRAAHLAAAAKVRLLLVVKAPHRNVGHVVQSPCRSTSTGFSNGSFRFRVCPNVNTQICKLALMAPSSISKPAAVDKVVDRAVVVAATN